jgi:RimJ/RimL family protein N-acetyltransferase
MAQGATATKDEVKNRKQLQAMQQVLAETVVTQLSDAGCDGGQLIEFASELIRCITERGFADDGDGALDAGAYASEADEALALPVLFRLEKVRQNRHALHGPRVCLRPVGPGDRPLLEAWRQDTEIRKTFGRDLLDHLIARIDALAGDERRRDFLICDGSDPSGRGVGAVCLFHIDAATGQAEIAKLLGDPRARGKGYAKEATGIVLGYAFRTLRLRRVYLQTAGFNLHNIKLNEKLGFRFEGILRESRALGGRLVDVVQMSMLAREYFRAFRPAGALDEAGEPTARGRIPPSGPPCAA